MVARIFSFLGKEWHNLNEAAMLLGVFAILSQILAVVRDRLFAHYFGAGATLDVYYTAFRIPDLLYVSLASFVSVTVVLPFLLKHQEAGEHQAAENLLADLFSRFLGFMFIGMVVAYFSMPYLLDFVTPGFTPAKHLELLSMARILLL